MVAQLIAALSSPAAKGALRAIMTIASFAYQQAQMNRMKAEADKRKGFVFTVRGKAEDIPVCYGKNLLGGIAVKHMVTGGFTSATDNSDKTFAEDFTNSNKSGSKNEFLHVQYALCRAGIEGVQWAKVNNIHYNDSDAKFKHLIRTFNGGDAITAVSDNIATANGIDSNNLFTNVAFASTTYRLNRNDYNYNGDPEVGFLIKGQKVPWIVRSGTSGNYTYAIKKSGSNIQYQYSNNPVRCLLDYLLNDKYGRGLSESEVDLESFYNATDVADTIVATNRTVGGKVNGQKQIITVPNLSNRPGNLEKRTYENILWYTSNTSQYWYWNKTAWVETEFDTKRPIPLYECNITLDTGDTIRNNMERILSTMGQAELTWSSEGKYKILLEYPTSPAEQLALVNSEHYFNEDSIIRDTVKLSWPSASDRVNQATVDFLNEHEDFKEDSMTWPPFSSELDSPYQVYRTQDGNQPFHSRMNLDGVTDPYHALAKAEQIVRQQRLFHNIELVVSKKGLSLEPGDFINITLPQSDIDTTVTTYVGGAAQPRYIYRVQSIEINSDFTVKIEAYSFNYQDLAWNVNDDIAFITQPLFDFTLDPPLSGTFTFDGGNVLGTNSGRLDWFVANDINAIEYLIEISSNNGTTWNELGTTTSNTFDVQGLQTGVYDFSIRSRSSLGSLSTRLLIENKTIQLKTVEKVAIIYANTANISNNTQSYNIGSKTFVAYYNYDSDLPTLPIRSGISFSSFIGPEGPEGDEGATGASTNIIFKRSSSQPATPPATSGIPSGWYDNAGSAPGTDILWASSGNKPVGSSNFNWGAPFEVEGKSIAEVAVYKKNNNTGLSGGTYDFVTQSLSAPSGWSTNAPALTINGDVIYRASGIASGSAVETSAPVTFGSPVVHSVRNDGTDGTDGTDGDDGDTGPRGAGWWRYLTGNSNSTSGLNNTTLNSYFATATGLTVVAGDRLIISNTNDEATGYLRNNANTSWTEQAEFIDGDLLVNGTVTATALAAESVTADKINVTKLEAITATLGDVDIDNTLELSGPVSGFIAGRTSTADFGTDGFYIGRTSTTGNTATGFQLSHTSLTSNNHPQLSSGTVQGVIHDDSFGLRVYEPVFYQRGTANASGGLITNTNQNITLSKGDIHTVTVIGGGGGGGHGASGNYFNSNRPGGGGGTTTARLNGANGYNGTRTYSAGGGAGGLGGFISGGNSDPSGGNSANGGNAGQASVFGTGGAGQAATSNTPAGDAPNSSYGAGGGGGGGISSNNTFGENGGDGGSHGQTLTITFDLTNANNNGTLTANAIGAGGAGHISGGAYGDGGDGRKGAISVAGVLDGYTSITLEDMYDPVYLSGAEKLASNNYPTNQSYPSGNSFNGGTNGRWGYLSYTGNKSNRGPFNFSGAGSWIRIGETYSTSGVVGPASGVEYYLAPGGSISINSNDNRYLNLNYVDL